MPNQTIRNQNEEQFKETKVKPVLKLPSCCPYLSLKTISSASKTGKTFSKFDLDC